MWKFLGRLLCQTLRRKSLKNFTCHPPAFLRYSVRLTSCSLVCYVNLNGTIPYITVCLHLFLLVRLAVTTLSRSFFNVPSAFL